MSAYLLPRVMLLAIVILAQTANAARPLNTDDARIVPNDSCQIETWSEFHKNKASEIWALPGCSIFHTEITLGGMFGLQSSALQFQVKRLFVDAEKHKWGIGIAIGNIHNYQIGADSENDIYAYIPITIHILSKMSLHFNIGYNIQSIVGGLYTLGIALELELTHRVFFIGEMYDTRYNPVEYQLGIRSWLIKDYLQIDTTYGNNVYGSNDFFSLGFRILTSKIF